VGCSLSSFPLAGGAGKFLKIEGKKMSKVVHVDDIPFEKVAWGLTKEIVAPSTVGAKRVKVKITEYLPGYVHRLHTHPDQEEIIFVLSGKGVSESANGERKEIGSGSVVYVSAGEPHATSNLSVSESLRAIIIKAPPEDEEVTL
jgi:quercetin dioxygenase-like cupin family protein